MRNDWLDYPSSGSSRGSYVNNYIMHADEIADISNSNWQAVIKSWYNGNDGAINKFAALVYSYILKSRDTTYLHKMGIRGIAGAIDLFKPQEVYKERYQKAVAQLSAVNLEIKARAQARLAEVNAENARIAQAQAKVKAAQEKARNAQVAKRVINRTNNTINRIDNKLAPTQQIVGPKQVTVGPRQSAMNSIPATTLARRRVINSRNQVLDAQRKAYTAKLFKNSRVI